MIEVGMATGGRVMGRAYTIENHPLQLRDWAHEHHRLLSASLGLIIFALAVAIAAPTVSMVRDALATYDQPSAEAAEVISSASLPREWRWSREAISFDHMYREGAAEAPMDFIRDARHSYRSSASE